MIVDDNRTEKQKDSHYVLIVGTDSFLSGWGKAKGGASYAAWACRNEDQSRVLEWVESRKDMLRVRVVYDMPDYPYRPKARNCAHLHIYVVTNNHPSVCRHNSRIFDDTIRRFFYNPSPSPPSIQQAA